MGAKSRQKTKAGGGVDLGESLRRVRERLAEGKSSSALQEAKQLAKQFPGEETETLLLEAYEKRFEGLQSAGLDRDARELLEVVRARFGDRATFCRTGREALDLRAGNAQALLKEWISKDLSEERRRRLEEVWRCRLVDPGALAQEAKLAPEDPLVVAAMAIDRAFGEVTKGELGASAREGLRAVGRRSPLEPWRRLILAIDAWNGQDIEGVRGHLGKLDPDSSAARLGGLLEILIGDRGVDGSLPQSAAVLLDRLSKGGVAIRREIKALDDAINQGNQSLAKDTYAELFSKVAAQSSRLAFRFALWGSQREDLGLETTQDLVFRWKRESEGKRLLATLHDKVDPWVSFCSWIGWYLHPSQSRLGDLQTALFVDKIAELEPDTRELAEHLGENRAFETFHPDEPNCQCPLEPMSTRADEAASGVVAHRIELCTVLSKKHGAEISPENLVADLSDLALRLDPTPARFARRVTQLRGAPVREREAVLEAWAEAFPEDGEPIVQLMQASASRGALKKALAYCERANQVCGTDPRVRAAPFRLSLQSFFRHMRTKKPTLAARDLSQAAESSSSETPLRRLLLAGAHAFLAQQTRALDLDAREALLVKLAGSTSRAERVLDLLWSQQNPSGVHRELVMSESDADVAAGILQVLRLADELATDGNGVPVIKKLRVNDACVAGLPEQPADLLRLCDWASDSEEYPFLYAVVWKALQKDGPHLSWAMHHRAECLDWVRASPGEQFECLRLAETYAERFPSGEGRPRHDAFPWGLPPIDDAEADALLAGYRAAGWKIRSRNRRRPPKKRRRSDVMQMDLFAEEGHE